MARKSVQIFSVSAFLLSLTGCAAFDPDPEFFNEVSPKPGVPWDPPTNAWYCEDKKIVPTTTDIVFPKINEESDVGDLIDFALMNHQVTREAWAKARASVFAYRAGQNTLFPHVNWTGSWYAIDSTSPSASVTSEGAGGSNPNTVLGNVTSGQGLTALGKSELIDSNLVFSYLLLDFGGRNAEIEVLRRALEEVNWTQNKTIQDVIINIMQKYYAYVYAKESLIAKQDDLKNANINLESAEGLYKAGVGTKLDYIQAKAAVEQAQLGVISSANDVDLFLGQLAIGLGLPAETRLEVRNLPSKFPVDDVEFNLEQLLTKMSSSRPDLAAAYANFLKQKANLKNQMSAALPYLSTAVNVQNSRYVFNTLAQTHVYNVAVQLNVPLFNGFQHKNNIKQAAEQVKEAYFNYGNVESQASLDVLNAYYQFVTAKQSMKSTEEFLKFSEESYEIALGSYRAGIGSILSLFTSQAALSDARAQRIQARTNWAVSLFNIAYATGILNTEFLTEKLPPKSKSNQENVNE